MREHFLTMLTHIMDKFMLPLHASYATIFVTFDLWMPCCGFDTFCLVVDYVDDEWVFLNVPIGIFEVVDTSGVALAEAVKQLFNEFGFTDRVLA